MIEISRLLPNPKGSDTATEWIAIYNPDKTAASLNGYVLRDKSGAEFALSGILPAGTEKQFFRPETKISLNNSDEIVYLVNQKKEIIQTVAYDTALDDEIIIARHPQMTVKTTQATAHVGAPIASPISNGGIILCAGIFSICCALVAGFLWKKYYTTEDDDIEL